MEEEDLYKWHEENGILVRKVKPSPFLNCYNCESPEKRAWREYFKSLECPTDSTKYLCHNCQKAFPKNEVHWASMEDEIVSVERTVYNGIITRDYNHYNRKPVPICKNCVKYVKIKDYIFLFFKYGFFIGGGAGILYAIISACMGETDLFGDFTVIFIFFIMMLGIISGLIFNNRRTSI